MRTLICILQGHEYAPIDTNRSVCIAKSARFFDRMDYNFGWICADAVACVVARCCVCVMHDSIILEQPGVVLAVHQDDFSGFTCICYRTTLGCRTSSSYTITGL